MRFIPFFILFFTLNVAFSFDVDFYAQHKITEITTFNKNTLHANQTLIEMPFAKEIILNKEQKELLNERIIIKIQLVYTKYRTVENFNQIELNKNRLLELKKLVPQLFEFPVWEYELISQTDGNSREECNNMFHGFVITFRPISTPDYINQESDYVTKLVTNLTKLDSIEKDKTPKSFQIKTRWDNGYVYDTIWGNKINIDFYPPPPANPYLKSLKQDSTVLNAFSRNKNWQNYMVVTDATGSMSPYYTQVLTWLREQASNENAKLFVFFNDGNRKSSKSKETLETGGIYISTKRDFLAVNHTLEECTRNGAGGGEAIENDVEAMLKGLATFSDAENIILIADNYESMRDYEFINKIKIPVHVFLCGVNSIVNPQYLDLARITNGSVHTKNNDIFNLNQLNEYETISIEGRDYVLKNGKFSIYYSEKVILR